MTLSGTDRDGLLAGAAREVITPPRGTYLIGYAERWRGCTGVHDHLCATALVLADDGRTVALVSCDLLCIHEDVVDRVRARLPGVEVVIACSHTHAAPITYADPRSSRARRAYIDLLVGRIAAAVENAQRSLSPAVLSWTTAEAAIGVNRRERTRDGRTVLGWNREGPADRSIGILRVAAVAGEPIATVVNYACHGTILPPQNLLVSSDWIGSARKRVEADLGGLMLFLQGAAGDINPDYEWGDGDPWEAVERLGDAVGGAVAAAVKAGGAKMSGVPLGIARREVAIPFEPAGDGAALPVAYRKKVLEFAGLPTALSFLTDRVLDRLYPWRPRLELKDGAWTTPLRISAVRVGDAALVTFGAEVFTEIGLAVKRTRPAGRTMFASVADGCIGYLPTDAARDQGGYEVDDGPYLYRFPARLAAGCETTALDAARAALADLL